MDSLWVYPNHPLVYQMPFAPALFYHIPKYPKNDFMVLKEQGFHTDAGSIVQEKLQEQAWR